MNLRVIIENQDGDALPGVHVGFSAPEYDFMDAGEETGSDGAISFDLPETYSDQIYVLIYVNGMRRWSDYVDSTGETVYLKHDTKSRS